MAKTPRLLANAGYEGYGKYVYYNIFAQKQAYPMIPFDRFLYGSPNTDTTLTYWGVETYPNAQVQRSSFLAWYLPEEYKHGDTIMAWISGSEPFKGIRGFVLIPPGFIGAAIIYQWRLSWQSLTGLLWMSSGFFNLLFKTVGELSLSFSEGTLYDNTYSQNLAVSAMWPDFWATFGDPSKVYRGFCPQAHGRSTHPQTFPTIGHAPQICEEYYNWAKQEWNAGNRVQALRWLGRACHFIHDVTVPNHSAPNGIYGLCAQKGHGDYEYFCDQKSLSCSDYFPNNISFDILPFDVSDKVWELGEASRPYLYFCDGLPTWCSWMWGGHNDNFEKVAREMMPLAAKYNVELVKKFLFEVGYTPDPVTDLRYDYAKENEVKIRWNYSVPKVIDNYVIRRRIAGGSWSQIGIPPPEQTYWVDNTVDE